MWVDVEQGTEEWHNLRLGLCTSSNFAKVMANFGKAFGNPAVEYAQKKALERVTGERLTDEFQSRDMMRGIEQEPLAIRLYEQETFNFVSNGGFYQNKTTGDSPDGLVGSKGMIEVKSVITNTQWKRIKSQKIDSAYKWQIQGHLFLSGREWCDFVSYCPEMNPKNVLFVKRVLPDKEMFKQLTERLSEFEQLIQKHVEILTAD